VDWGDLLGARRDGKDGYMDAMDTAKITTGHVSIGLSCNAIPCMYWLHELAMDG